MLARSLTRHLGWCLDNLLPPVLRDSRGLMRPLFWLLFGKRAGEFMRFKEAAPFLSPAEFRAWYRRLADSHIQRPTDLSPGSLAAVLEAVRGGSALDVGSGRGYLAGRLAGTAGRTVVGVDLQVEPAPGRVRLVRAAGERLPFRAGAFDTVVCSHVLEHVQDAAAALAELRRVARRRVVIVFPRQREYPFTFDLHLRFFPYAFSVHQLTRNPAGRCRLVDGDFVYVEDLDGPAPT